MKRIIISLLGLLIIVNSSGQWYKQKYGVERIDMLNTEELNEAQNSCRDAALAGGGILLLGGASLLSGYLYLHNGLGEDPGFIEDLLGAEVMGKGLIGLGGAFVVTGAITGVVSLIRLSALRSSGNNYSVFMSANISSCLKYNPCSGSFIPSVGLSVRF
jgi:hypothetical protein